MLSGITNNSILLWNRQFRKVAYLPILPSARLRMLSIEISQHQWTITGLQVMFLIYKHPLCCFSFFKSRLGYRCGWFQFLRKLTAKIKSKGYSSTILCCFCSLIHKVFSLFHYRTLFLVSTSRCNSIFHGLNTQILHIQLEVMWAWANSL